MAEENSSFNLKQFFGATSELAKYVTAILAYVLAIAGISPTYPQLISVLTIAITTTAIWVWRWPLISKKFAFPANEPLLVVGKDQPQNSEKEISKMWEPFRSSTSHTFVFSLFRRRTELTVLLTLTAFSVWFSVVKAQKVYEELSGLECAYAGQGDAPRVIIGDFYVASGSGTAFEENIFSQLRNQFDRAVTVCHYNHVIENGQNADDLGKTGSQTIVIWGVSDQDYFQIHITPIDWSGLELSWKASQEHSRALRDWSIEYVSRIVLLQIGFIKGEIGREVQDLYVAIDAATREEWATDNLGQLAPAYYLVGTLFDDEGNLGNAIEAYTKTIEVDPKYDVAFLARGNSYVHADELLLARADFDELIKRDSFLVADAYASRSEIQPDWEGKKGDLLKAIEINPDEALYYHLLGYSALRQRDIHTAITAYENSLDYLDSGSRDDFIAELRKLALQEPSLQSDIENIINLLLQAHLH
jgi:tetratricopeptide (TPR) repeat protein